MLRKNNFNIVLSVDERRRFVSLVEIFIAIDKRDVNSKKPKKAKKAKEAAIKEEIKQGVYSMEVPPLFYFFGPLCLHDLNTAQLMVSCNDRHHRFNHPPSSVPYNESRAFCTNSFMGAGAIA